MTRELTVAEFESLYRATAAELFGFVRRRSASDPEDLVAEVYAIAWRRRTDLPPPSLRRAWLFGAARRLLLARAREQRRRDDATRHASRLGVTSSAPKDDQREDVVARALDRLRPAERELLELVEWERMSPGEVAVVLGVRPGTIRVRLHRARQAFAADPEVRALVEAGATAGDGAYR